MYTSSEAVCPPVGVDWEVRENDGEAGLGGAGVPFGGDDSGLSWPGPLLGLPADADGAAGLVGNGAPLAVAELLSGGDGEGVGLNLILGFGGGEAVGEAVTETGSAWH